MGISRGGYARVGFEYSYRREITAQCEREKRRRSFIQSTFYCLPQDLANEYAVLVAADDNSYASYSSRVTISSPRAVDERTADSAVLRGATVRTMFSPCFSHRRGDFCRFAMSNSRIGRRDASRADLIRLVTLRFPLLSDPPSELRFQMSAKYTHSSEITFPHWEKNLW